MIAAMQRKLAALIRGEAVDGDAYIDEVARSVGLAVTRDVIVSWRDLLLREGCPLTVALLQQRGRYRLDTCDAPAFAEELVVEFLDGYVDDADPLLAAIARTERAIAAGEAAEISWPCDPEEAMERLKRGSDVAGVPEGDYRVSVSA